MLKKNLLIGLLYYKFSFIYLCAQGWGCMLSTMIAIFASVVHRLRLEITIIMISRMIYAKYFLILLFLLFAKPSF